MQLREGCVSLCPGCAHRFKTLEESLAQKEQWLKKMLSPWEETFNPIRSVEESERWDYRGKVCLNTAYGDGAWKFGMLRRDELIDIPECPVHTPLVRKTIAILKSVLPDGKHFPMAFYYHTHAQLCLILKCRNLPDMSWFTSEVEIELKSNGLEGLAIHLHPSAGRRLFDKIGWHQVFGRNFSVDEHGLIYGNTSFHQLIQKLYMGSLDMAENFFKPMMPAPVVDLYCGRGVSLSRWTKMKNPSIGIETSGEAVTSARINAPEALVLQGTCERRIPQLESWRNQIGEKINQFALYTNPPRTGMEPLVTEWIGNNLKPERIAYLSCSAGTLKKDLEKLCLFGYQVISITPFDFFPQTYHVECLVLLGK